ncbi:hypothetical protein [Pseudomonas sp. 18175]|uniref:hypothetical protein n=1 Tax=Pseudomonas sp. 18175 TaxID=3390056 RepID=UPI003D2290FB
MLSTVPQIIPSSGSGRFDPPPFAPSTATEHTVPVQQVKRPEVSTSTLAFAVLDAREKERWLAAIEARVEGKADDTILDLDDIRFDLARGGDQDIKQTTALQFLHQLWPHINAQIAPSTVGQARNLINWLRNPLPASPTMGDYSGAWLGAQTPVLPGLHPQERQQLITAFDRDVGGGILNSMPSSTHSMDERIARHLNNHAPLNRFRQQMLLASIGRNEAGLTKAQLNQLLLTAQMLRIDPELGLRRNHVAGFDLYAPANAGRTLAQVRQALEDHLVHNKGVRPEAVNATAHIMLASVAPEFLVRDMPDTLHIGSPAWLALRKSVAWLEESAAGSSRTLTYDQVLVRSTLEPLTPEQAVLFHAAETEPLLDWATLHGVIALREDDQYTVDDLKQAAQKYSLYIDATHQANTVLSSPVVGRRALAEADLKQVFPGHDVNKPMHFVDNVLFFAPTHDVGYRQSLVDLHMLGVLKDGAFGSLLHDSSWVSTPYTSEFAPEFAGLKTQFKKLKYSRQMLDQTAKDNANRFHNAVSTGLKDILSKMPYADRHALETQTLTFYQVQAESIDGKGASGRSSQQQLDAVQGRYGFLISAGEGNNAKCFEFFPMSGTYVERPEFLAALDSGEPVVPNLWNIRMKSHVDGREAGASEIQVRALRPTLPASPGSGTRLSPLGFFSPRAEAITHYVAKQNLVLKLDNLQALATGSTPREDFEKRAKAVVKAVVDTLIPFKACYDDIVSGRVKQDLGALAGCATDAVTAISVVAGGVAEGVGAIARAESGISRLEAATRAVGTLTNGLFNPVAGLAEPLANASRWVKDKALLRLSRREGPLRDAWRAQLDEQRAGQPMQMRSGSLKEAGNVGKDAAGTSQATRAEVKQIVERAQPLMVSKLDDALQVMADPALTDDVDFVLKNFQGMSPTQARKLMSSRLSGLKAKAEVLTAKNVKFMRSKNHDWVAQVNPEDFKLDPSGKFIEVNIDGSKRYYQHFGSNEGAMSNALIHELDHLPGKLTQGSLDFAYLTRLRKNEENAAGLLNLAKGHTLPSELVSAGEDASSLVGKTGVNMFGSRAGSLNAESTMTSVALLAQLKNDPALFKQNRTMIENALNAFGGAPIIDQVPIKIVSKRAINTPAPGLMYMVDRSTHQLLGVYRLMQHPPGTVNVKQPPTEQTGRNQALKQYIQEHLVL